MGESKLSPGSAGLQSGPNVPSPATTIDPITGKAHVTATGLTRAQLASQRAAAAINGTPANGTQPPPNGVSKAVAGEWLHLIAGLTITGVKSANPHLPSSSWSDDISRAFDRIKVATPTIDEDEVSTFTPQTSLPTRTKASGAPSAFKAPKLAPPTAPSDGTVVFAPGTRAPTTKRLSVNTANGLFTASLDPETMVFFIDDDTVLPGETPKASPGVGESKRIAVPRAGVTSSGLATPQAAGGDASGPASPASANGATIHAASRMPAPSAAAAAVPQVAVQPPPEAVVSIADGAADRDVPTGSPMSPKRAGMVGRPAMVSLGAVGGASALRELAALSTDDANALAVTSETRRGAERTYTSSSTTAIHHGAEGKPNERTSLGARPDDGDGDNTTVDTGTVSGDVSRTQTPAGDNSLPQTPASLAIASTTKHGLDPAASTASITAIRNGSEGKSVSHPGSPVSSTSPSHAAQKSPVPSTTQPTSTSDPKSPTSPTSALSAPSANGSSSSDLRTPGHAYRAVGHPASRGLPGTTREVGTYPTPQYDGEAAEELAHHHQSGGALHNLAQKVSDKVEGKKPAKAEDEAKADEDTPPALPEKDSPVSPASPTSASSGVTGAPLSTPSKLGDAQRRKPVPAADAELARTSGNSSPDGQPPVVATVPIADNEADAEAQTPTTAKKANGIFNRSAANDSATTPTTPKSPSSPLQSASAAFAGFGSALRRTASGTLLNTGTKERPIISDPVPVPVDKETPGAPGRPSGSFFRSHKRSESAAPNLNPNAEAAARPPTSFFNHSRNASAASAGSGRKKGGIFNKLKADFKVIGGRIRNDDKR